MFKKKLILMSLVVVASVNSFASDEGELPGPGPAPAAVTQKMSSKERADYRMLRIEAYNQLYNTLGSESRADEVFRVLEGIQGLSLKYSLSLFLDLYRVLGSSSLTVIQDIVGNTKEINFESVDQQVQFAKAIAAMTGRADYTIDWLSSVRKLVPHKIENYRVAKDIYLATYSLTGSRSEVVNIISQAAEINASSSGVKASLSVFKSAYSMTGSISNSMTSMRLVRAWQGKGLVETSSEGIQILSDMYQTYSSFSTLVSGIFPGIEAVSKNKNDFKQHIGTWISLYRASGSQGNATDFTVMSANYKNAGLVETTTDFFNLYKSVYHLNGSTSSSKDLFVFLSGKAADAYEFKSGVEMYMKLYKGSHSRTMATMSTLW